MAAIPVPAPTVLQRGRRRSHELDSYGHARLPASTHDMAPERVDKIHYGRFRNVYLYITEACQLRCEHCYMGERLERALKMPFDQIIRVLTTWRKMGGSKLTVLGGEPTLHPDYIDVIRYATALGYEHVITTSNGLDPAIRKFRRMQPNDFAYIQISLRTGQPRTGQMHPLGLVFADRPARRHDPVHRASPEALPQGRGLCRAQLGLTPADNRRRPETGRGPPPMSTDTIPSLVADVATTDWDDLAAVTATSDKLLTALDSDRTMLRELAEQAVDNPELIALCEHYDILDKIILHDDPSGWRLRLHVFLPGYFDRPHNHRWTYSSRILHGSYTHTLYGTDDQLSNGNIDVTSLQPRMVRTESIGDFYTLHHSMIHSVTAQPYTTSLIVRGPAVKDRFLVTDRITGQAWWQHGAATESPKEAARKRLSATQANACLEGLTELGVLN